MSCRIEFFLNYYPKMKHISAKLEFFQKFLDQSNQDRHFATEIVEDKKEVRVWEKIIIVVKVVHLIL